MTSLSQKQYPAQKPAISPPPDTAYFCFMQQT